MPYIGNPQVGFISVDTIDVSGTIDGRDVSVDGTKLDTIETSATADQTNAEIRAAVEAASDSNVFTDADHTKLNAIEASATADQTASEIRTLVESASDSNVFTDADHTKLNGIEASADVTDATNVANAGAAMLSGATFTGNVGVGASPTLDGSLAGLSVNSSGTVLHVNDVDGASLKLTDPATGANRGLGITLQGTSAAISNCESGELRFGTGNAERMRLTSSGISVTGDVLPNANATRNLGSNSLRYSNLYAENARARYFYNADDTNTYMEFPENDQIRFITAGGERARVTTSQFMVGKTANGLNATGHELGDDGYVYHIRNGNIMWLNTTASSANAITFMRSASTAGSITMNSSGTFYNTTSDIRLKQDIEPLAATDKLMAMKPVSFAWKADPDGPRSMGFIAQEMEEIMPEAVSTGEDDMMSMDYGRITPILVSALQDAHRKIEQLEQRLADMEAK